MIGDARDAFGVKQQQFLQHARARAAERETAAAGRRPAVEPGLKEHRAHAIPDRDPAHAWSHGGNFAGAVGERDQRKPVRAALARHGYQVAIVQRCRAHPDHDLTGAGLRLRPVDQFHGVDRPFACDLPDFQRSLPVFRRSYAAKYPPSTTCDAPVMNDALSEHIQTTASAISSGTPMRFIGTFAKVASSRVSTTSLVIGVVM